MSPAPEREPQSTARSGDSAAWLAGLAAGDPAVQVRLHELLLRAGRAEVARRAGRLRITGPELDDLAHQAAADAMIAILRQLTTFRGESRFTTWAYKFVIFEVSGKVTRHFWARAAPPLETPLETSLETSQWERLPDRFGFTPEQAAQARDLLSAVRQAVDSELSERQRAAFVAVVVDGVPLDVLVERWQTNRNAIYKTIFDARRKIRAYLVANGYVEDNGGR